MRTRLHAASALVAAAALLVAGCEDGPIRPELTDDSQVTQRRGGPPADAGPPGEAGPPSAGDAASFSFDQPVFEIEAAPNGNILVPETVLASAGVTGSTKLYEIRTQGPGGRRKLAEFTTPDGAAPIHGLAAIGRGSILAAQGGLDLAEHAALLHVTPDGQRVVGDIEGFETAQDPDRFVVGDWKDPQCAPASGPFTPGPQSNPYHVAATSGSTVLVADAAGNTLLRVTRSGDIEVVAVFTPPTADGGASADPADWAEFAFPGGDGTPGTDDDPTEGDCFVQPVPNSVAVGPDGAIYVGELTGVSPGPSLEMSRVWRIEPGTTGALCDGTSAACEVVAAGFTSIIDLGFGPDGGLHVVELDENSWLTSIGVGTPAGGTVNRCDVSTGTCQVAEIGGETLEGLTFPAGIEFTGDGDAWLLENNLAAPTVRKLN